MVIILVAVLWIITIIFPIKQSTNEYQQPIINTKNEMIYESQINVDYDIALDYNGSTPIVWEIAISNLPDGLKLDPIDGRIYGKPIKSGTYTFAIRASNLAGYCIEAYTITIN